VTLGKGDTPLFLTKLLGYRFDKKTGHVPYLALVAVVGALLMAACAAATPAQELAAMLNEQAAAWSRGDLDAFCAVYVDDATFISPSGLTKGRQAVLDRYRKKYVDKTGMGSLTLAVEEVRAADGGNASVIARWTLTWPDKPKAEGLTLLVMKKTPGGWRIVQDASM
jgi:uncharacterized protein (TIGR02246 family)